MITKFANKELGNTDLLGTFNREYRGLSTDSKPTDAQNGDVFFEMNTSKAYMFNEDAGTWVEL